MLIIQLKKQITTQKLLVLKINLIFIIMINILIILDVFNARIAQANLITKTDFHAKLSSLNKKISQNKTKPLLVKSELNKLKTLDSGYFIGKIHFEEDGTQNYLVFQPTYRIF